MQLFLLFIALLAGAGSIANDNRANALLVYLSKPCRKVDYLFGKWAGLAMLIAGVPFYSQNHLFLILSVIGFVAMFAGAVIAVTGPRVPTAGKGSPPPGGARAKKPRAGGSFTSRMEDRFRRRFDE